MARTGDFSNSVVVQWPTIPLPLPFQTLQHGVHAATFLPMAQTHFERLIQEAMEKTARDVVSSVIPGDAARHAMGCGRYKAFQECLELYRQAARTDEMETDRL